MLLCWHFFNNLPPEQFKQAVTIFGARDKFVELLDCVQFFAHYHRFPPIS